MTVNNAVEQETQLLLTGRAEHHATVRANTTMTSVVT